MILIGLFLVVLAGAFLLQSLGIGGDRLFEFVWPVLVALIGLGFISEARKEKRCPVCDHAKHAKGKDSTHAVSHHPKPAEAPVEHRPGEDAGFTRST